ncbi:MAG: amidase [Burkholderiaceae bacterium]
MSDDRTLARATATELVALVASGKLSPVELVRASLARAERLQPQLNCFITLCGDRAIDEARAAEREVARGQRVGRLHGIPFTVKDLVDTAGVRTTFGAVPFADRVPAEDAVAVGRLRAAGAILIGKTTTPEFGSKCLTDSPLFGRTRNAWHAGRTSGGSSGGAAVATAAGITAIAIATDGGGSTRIPAACNGVVGFKQTIGAVPHGQALDLIANQTYVTPTTRTVADTALMMTVIGGEHRVDPWSIGIVRPDYEAAVRTDGDLRGRRVLACLAPPGRPVAADVRAAFENALARLRALGAEIDWFDGAGFEVEPIWRVINHTVWRTRFAALVAERPEAYSETFRRQVASAADVDAVTYQQAMFARTALFHRTQALFERADVLAMPTLTRTALPIEQDLFAPIEIDGRPLHGIREHWFPWTMVFNMTGHPAISVPCGWGAEGLPCALQLVGRFRGDAPLLEIAARFEASAAAGDGPAIAEVDESRPDESRPDESRRDESRRDGSGT